MLCCALSTVVKFLMMHALLCCTSRVTSAAPRLQEKLTQAKEDELQASLANTAKALEEARAAAQEQARRLADEERQLARLQHEADMKVNNRVCTSIPCRVPRR